VTGERVALWVSAVNQLMDPEARRARRLSRPSLPALQATAAARTGIVEPPDPQFLADLRELHACYMSAPELSFLGMAAVRTELVRHLSNWLVAREFLREHPRTAFVPVERPVFVVGLPRTGTTLLHTLLASLPGHRAPRMWELLAPVPASAGQPQHAQRIRAARRLARISYLASPSLRVIHPIDAHAPEECGWVLPHSMTHYTRARMPAYRDWYASRDATPDYLYLRQQLQILQWQRPAHRWILKSPFHLWHLDALLRVFPDATIVWAHRDPAVALASWCSLTEVTMTFHNRTVDLPLLGQDWAGLWSWAFARAAGVRAASSAQFLDVSYSQLTAGTQSALDQILAGLDAADAVPAQARLAALAQARGPARGAHRYSLRRYGLTQRDVADAFPAGW
jgi:hypothetical protein